MDQNQDPIIQIPKRNREAEDSEPPNKRQCTERFNLTVGQSNNELQVDKEMAEHVRKQMNTYIADNDLKQQILDIYLNPTNIDSRKT